MSEMKRKAPDSREQACMLCGRADADPNICGPIHKRNGLCAHTFCLSLANGLYRLGSLHDGILGFLLEDIQHTIKRASQKQCFVCGERGATITCTETGCERSFHLPCASEGECVTQFFGQYRSFCWEHRPQQAVQAAPEQDTICIICMDPVGDSKSYHTMVCPACSHAWFHRGCIQGQAVSAGILYFQCPICRNQVEFRSEMSIMGIQVPVRGPTWEDGNAFASLQERHQRCDVSECLYPQGREQAEGQGPWQLLLCRSCAAEGTHRRCSNLTNSTGTWECDSCAGVGTAGATPDKKPLTAGTSSPRSPEPAPKTPQEQPRTRKRCWEQQQHQICQGGGIGVPQWIPRA
ncbi:PHD finger protein 7-like [Anser cygnoides]|uniref:PHD finger protein 7-like n=1 Tax=Anser cygnoides TaxID=8845 RepID=UPI0034D17198